MQASRDNPGDGIEVNTQRSPETPTRSREIILPSFPDSCSDPRANDLSTGRFDTGSDGSFDPTSESSSDPNLDTSDYPDCGSVSLPPPALAPSPLGSV